MLITAGLVFSGFINLRSSSKFGRRFNARDAPHPVAPAIGARGHALGSVLDRADRAKCRASRARARYRAGSPIRGSEAGKIPINPEISAPRRVWDAPGFGYDPTRAAVCGRRRYTPIVASCGPLSMLWNPDVRVPEQN